MRILVMVVLILSLSGCCSLFCKPTFIPVPIPPQKVALPPEPACDDATETTPDAEVVRSMIKCVVVKKGYIKEIKTRLGGYIDGL